MFIEKLNDIIDYNISGEISISLYLFKISLIAANLLNIIGAFSFLPLITRLTRLKEKPATVIDLILVNTVTTMDSYIFSCD